MQIFIITFYGLCAVSASVYFLTKKKQQETNEQNHQEYKRFRNSYLIVYLLAMAGDWLQGPYVYALYDHYKMSKRVIEFLFVAGFGASMIFGTVVGSVADKFGRRRNCILYGVIYILSCATKHFNNFWILLIGRLLGGTATSILWSGFEAWLVHEHRSRGFSEAQLQETFSMAFLGNSLVAISSGVIAQYAVDAFGFVAPFDIAALLLICMVVYIATYWTENFGDANADIQRSFVEAWRLIRTDKRVVSIGLIQSLFEASMYCFVLEWTPALTPKRKVADDGHAGKIPHGYIFAAFMVAMMIGSQLFPTFSSASRPESFMRAVLATACATFALPSIANSDALIPFVFMGFLVLEFCIGIYWPAFSTIRSQYVPDDVRATMINFFRMPLNLIIVIILTQDLPIKFIFKSCSAFLLLAFLLQCYLCRATRNASASTTTTTTTTIATTTSAATAGKAEADAAAVSRMEQGSTGDDVGKPDPNAKFDAEMA